MRLHHATQRVCNLELMNSLFLEVFKKSPPKDTLTDSRERGREGERGRETSMAERNMDWLPLIWTPTWDRTWNLGMCPDWELNPWPFGLRDDAPTNWATPARAGNFYLIFSSNWSYGEQNWGWETTVYVASIFSLSIASFYFVYGVFCFFWVRCFFLLLW